MKRLFIVIVAILMVGNVFAVSFLRVEPLIRENDVGVKLVFDGKVEKWRLGSNPSKTVYTLQIDAEGKGNFVLPIQAGPLEAVSLIAGEGQIYVNFFHIVPVREPTISADGNTLNVTFKRAARFSEEEYVFTGEEWLLKDILKYIMGKSYLNLNYVISEKLETEKVKLTMRLAGKGADDVFRDILLAKSGRISYAYLPDGTLYLGTPDEVKERIDEFWMTYSGVRLTKATIEELRSKLPSNVLLEYFGDKSVLFVYGDLQSHLKIANLLSVVSPVAEITYDFYPRLASAGDRESIAKRLESLLKNIRGDETGIQIIPDLRYSIIVEVGEAKIWVPEKYRQMLLNFLASFESNLLSEKEEPPARVLRSLRIENDSLRSDMSKVLDLLGITAYKEVEHGLEILCTPNEYEEIVEIFKALKERYEPIVTEVHRISSYIDADMARVLFESLKYTGIVSLEPIILKDRSMTNVIRITGKKQQIEEALKGVEEILELLGEESVRKLFKVPDGSAEEMVEKISRAYPYLGVERVGDIIIISGEEKAVNEASQLLESLKPVVVEQVEEILPIPRWALEMGVVDTLENLFPDVELKGYDKLEILSVRASKNEYERFKKRYDEVMKIAREKHEELEKETLSATPAVRVATNESTVIRIVPVVPQLDVEKIKVLASFEGLDVQIEVIQPFGYFIKGAESGVEKLISYIEGWRTGIQKRTFETFKLKEGIDPSKLDALFEQLGVDVNVMKVGDVTLVVGMRDDVKKAGKIVDELDLRVSTITSVATSVGVKLREKPERISRIFRVFHIDPTVDIDSLKMLMGRLGYEIDLMRIGEKTVFVGDRKALEVFQGIIDDMQLYVEEQTIQAVSTRTTEPSRIFRVLDLDGLDVEEVANVVKTFYPDVMVSPLVKLKLLIVLGPKVDVEEVTKLVETLKSVAKTREETSMVSTDLKLELSEETEHASPAISEVENELPFEFSVNPDGSFSIDVASQPLGLVIEGVAERLGKSVALVDYPEEKVDLKAKSMTWEGFLNFVEEFYGYSVVSRGSLTIIQKSPVASTDTTVGMKKYVFRVSHNIDEIAKLVEFYGGRVYEDKVNELLIVTGISEETREVLESLLENLSRPKPVVKISAEIIDKSILEGLDLSLSSLIDLGHAGLTLSSEGNIAELTLSSTVIDILDYRELMEAIGSKLRFQTTLSLDKSKSGGDVLSKPQITTVSGEEARMFVGQKIPYIQGYDEDGKPIIAYSEPGIELKITPIVKKDGTISLDIFVKVSDVEYYNPTPDLTYPIEKTRQAETKVIVTEDQAVVIGGLVRTFENVQESKLPFLGDLPFIGQFFRSYQKTQEKSDLLIFITAEVVQPGS
ncbi:MAG: type II and III secretion system protein [Thermotogae bacterium]|nr:type II and III secretion system protein [Thermotogota bacterium]